MNKFKLGEFVFAFGYVAEILDIRVQSKIHRPSRSRRLGL